MNPHKIDQLIQHAADQSIYCRFSFVHICFLYINFIYFEVAMLLTWLWAAQNKKDLRQHSVQNRENILRLGEQARGRRRLNSWNEICRYEKTILRQQNASSIPNLRNQKISMVLLCMFLYCFCQVCLRASLQVKTVDPCFDNTGRSMPNGAPLNWELALCSPHERKSINLGNFLKAWRAICRRNLFCGTPKPDLTSWKATGICGRLGSH